MLILGSYHWWPRRIAFRHDYCRSCSAPCLATRIRTVDVFHVYWIPLLPYGLWSRWFCGTCGARPHASTKTRRGMKIAGAIALALMSVLMWSVPIESPDDAWVAWAMRIGLPAAAAGLTMSAWRQRHEPRFAALLAGVAPFSGFECPLCQGPLVHSDGLRCSTCGAAHQPLAAD